MRSESLRKRSGGQALVMTTISIIAMTGLMGLAVDLGWSFFVQKVAQEGADAAALAAVEGAYVDAGRPATISCNASGGTSGKCYTAARTLCSASPSGNLAYACTTAEASKNGGFTAGEISVEANTSPSSMSPAISGIGTGTNGVQYLVRVRIARQIPQLFSAVLGNTTATVAARATAALLPVAVNGSLILTGHANDPAQSCGLGTDLCASGSETIEAQDGILLASSAHNSGGSGYAGKLQGSATITNTSFTWVRSPGTVSGWPSGVPVIQKSDPTLFADPLSGKGQPPIPSVANTGWATDGSQLHALTGALSCSPCTPGIYYMVDGSGKATGGQISIGSNTSFSCGSNCEVSSSSFGNYVFVGGLSISGATVTFGPGRYILAGQNGSGTSGHLLYLDKNVTLQDGGSTTAGEIFMMTDGGYKVGSNSVQNYLNLISSWATSCSAGACVGAGSTTAYGDVGVKSGTGNNINVHLYGLDKNYTLPTSDTGYNGNTLNDFAPALTWQDQGNSNVLYDTSDKNSPLGASATGSGNVVTSGTYTGYTCPPGGSPAVDACVLSSPLSTNSMTFDAQGTSSFNGLLYQPRGGNMVVQGGPSSGIPTSPLDVVTGSLGFGGSGEIKLTSIDEPPLTVLEVALVE